MADNFFDFETDFPKKNVLGRKGLEDEFLTAEVEDEYDTLNDETFGQAINDDWEDAHEKLAELIVQKTDFGGNSVFNDSGGNSVFNDSLLENDESQDEIVSKSISQLGLEDDLDDPAIMTIARNCNSVTRLRSFKSSSPPPPAILETEVCGSPKTHSIWSTTPKDSGITSFLQSLHHSSSSLAHQNSSPLSKSASDNVFITPPKAWRAEDLERDLLSSKPELLNTSSGNWPQVPQLNTETHQNAVNKVISPRFPNNLDHIRNNTTGPRVLTREEVERQLHSDPRIRFPSSVPNYVAPPLMPPGMPTNLMSPIGTARNNNIGAPNMSSPIVPLRPMRGPYLGNNCSVPDQYFMNARMNLMHNQMPLRGPPMPNLPPGFNPSNMNLNHSKLLSLPPRSIAHPLLQKQFQFPMVVYNNYYENENFQNAAQNVEDEYVGLMSQKERDWLFRIQMLQLKSENPYVEDYYFTTQVARRCQKEYSENATKTGGDAPEIILPETSRHENKAFVPTQFEGSLGKLQAVSVNFPRKVLDITITKPLEDDEGKAVTNQSLMRYRRLLLDIEQLFCFSLEIEDEERRILAKPESEAGPHLENIVKLKKDIFSALFDDTTSEDNFQSIMTIRKGRNLVMRVFKIFNKENQLHLLVSLFQCLAVCLKKDQNDNVLVQHVIMITDVIQKLSLSEVVQLGEALDKGIPESVKGIEKDNLMAALKNKFGSSVICTMLTHAESLYGGFELFESDVQAKWAKTILHLVECLCTLETSQIASPVTPCLNLLSHFQRFAVDRDKFQLLQEKLKIFEVDSKNDVQKIV